MNTITSQFEVCQTAIIRLLSDYITLLVNKYSGNSRMAPTIRHLGELRDALQDEKLRHDANNDGIRKATAKLGEATTAIDAALKSEKQTQQRLEEAAAIIGLVGAALSWIGPIV